MPNLQEDKALWKQALTARQIRSNISIYRADNYMESKDSLHQMEQDLSEQLKNGSESTVDKQLVAQVLARRKQLEESEKFEKTVQQLEEVIQEQELYQECFSYNQIQNKRISFLDGEIAEWNARFQQVSQDDLEMRRQKQAESLDNATTDAQHLKKMLEDMRDEADAYRYTIDAKKRLIRRKSDPTGEHAKTLETVVAKLDQVLADKRQLKLQVKDKKESLEPLRGNLKDAEKTLEDFQEIGILEELKAAVTNTLIPLDEGAYNARQELLSSTLDNLNGQILAPIKRMVQDGLPKQGLPPMDMTGKDKNNLLVWNAKEKALVPLADEALRLLQPQNGQLGGAIYASIGTLSRALGHLHVYPNKDSITPDIFKFRADRNFDRIDRTQPEPPKEPGRGYKILDWFAGLVGKRNATCKQYDDDLSKFTNKLRILQGPEGYKEHIDKQAAERTKAQTLKTEKTPAPFVDQQKTQKSKTAAIDADKQKQSSSRSM